MHKAAQLGHIDLVQFLVNDLHIHPRRVEPDGEGNSPAGILFSFSLFSFLFFCFPFLLAPSHRRAIHSRPVEWNGESNSLRPHTLAA